MGYQVSLVPGTKFHTVEERVFELLDPAIDLTGGRFSRDSYAQDLIEDKSQLWIAFDEESLSIDGAIITQIEVYPHKTMMNYALCGGTDLAGWHDPMHEVIKRFAKDCGCDGTEITGRAGWSRFMENNHNWSQRFVFLDYFFDEEEGEAQNAA